MDFPKVYFFGSLRNSLSPILENLKIAANFVVCCQYLHKNSHKWMTYV